MKRILALIILLVIVTPLLAEDTELEALQAENARLKDTVARLNRINRDLAAENARLKELVEKYGLDEVQQKRQAAKKIERGTVEAMNADLHAAGYDLKEKKTYTDEQLAVIKATAESWVGKPIKAGPLVAWGNDGTVTIKGQECTRRYIRFTNADFKPNGPIEYSVAIPTTKYTPRGSRTPRPVFTFHETRTISGTVHSVSVSQKGVEVCILLKKLEKAD